MKYLLKLFAKSALLPLRLTAASALDAGVHKKKTVLMKLFSFLKEFDLLVKDVAETIEKETK